MSRATVFDDLTPSPAAPAPAAPARPTVFDAAPPPPPAAAPPLRTAPPPPPPAAPTADPQPRATVFDDPAPSPDPVTALGPPASAFDQQLRNEAQRNAGNPLEDAAIAQRAAADQTLAKWFERNNDLAGYEGGGQFRPGAPDPLRERVAADPFPHDQLRLIDPQAAAGWERRLHEDFARPRVQAAAQLPEGWNIPEHLAATWRGEVPAVAEAAGAAGAERGVDILSGFRAVPGVDWAAGKLLQARSALRGASAENLDQAKAIKQGLPQTPAAGFVTGQVNMLGQMGAAAAAGGITGNPAVGSAVFSGLFAADSASRAYAEAKMQGRAEGDALQDATFAGIKAGIVARIPMSWPALARETAATRMAGAYLAGTAITTGDALVDQAWRSAVHGEPLDQAALERVGEAFLTGGAPAAVLHGVHEGVHALKNPAPEARTAEPPIERRAGTETPPFEAGDYGPPRGEMELQPIGTLRRLARSRGLDYRLPREQLVEALRKDGTPDAESRVPETEPTPPAPARTDEPAEATPESEAPQAAPAEETPSPGTPGEVPQAVKSYDELRRLGNAGLRRQAELWGVTYDARSTTIPRIQDAQERWRIGQMTDKQLWDEVRGRGLRAGTREQNIETLVGSGPESTKVDGTRPPIETASNDQPPAEPAKTPAPLPTETPVPDEGTPAPAGGDLDGTRKDVTPDPTEAVAVADAAHRAARNVGDDFNDHLFLAGTARIVGGNPYHPEPGGRQYERVDPVVGQQYDSHGIAKGTPAEQVRALFKILHEGPDFSRAFHTAPFEVPDDMRATVGAGLGTAGGTGYKDGVAVVVGGRGKLIKDGGIRHVFVNDAVPGLKEAVQRAFPNVDVHYLSEQKAVLEGEAAPAKAPDALPPAQPESRPIGEKPIEPPPPGFEVEKPATKGTPAERRAAREAKKEPAGRGVFIKHAPIDRTVEGKVWEHQGERLDEWEAAALMKKLSGEGVRVVAGQAREPAPAPVHTDPLAPDPAKERQRRHDELVNAEANARYEAGRQPHRREEFLAQAERFKAEREGSVAAPETAAAAAPEAGNPRTTALRAELDTVRARLAKNEAAGDRVSGATLNPDMEIGGIRSRSRKQKDRIFDARTRLAHENVALNQQRATLERQIDAIESGAADRQQTAKQERDRRLVAWFDGLKPGDTIKPGNNELTIKRKNATSVTTESGTRYSLQELTGVRHEDAELLRSTLEPDAPPPADAAFHAAVERRTQRERALLAEHADALRKTARGPKATRDERRRAAERAILDADPEWVKLDAEARRLHDALREPSSVAEVPPKPAEAVDRGEERDQQRVDQQPAEELPEEGAEAGGTHAETVPPAAPPGQSDSTPADRTGAEPAQAESKDVKDILARATPKPPASPKPAPAAERKPLEDQLRHVVATSAEFHDDLLHRRAATDPGETLRQRGFAKSVTVGQRVAHGSLEPKALVDLDTARRLARTLPADHPAHVVLRKLEALEAGDRGDAPTGIKNATVEQERAARGMAPAEQAARRSFGEVWDDAKRDLDEDPDLGRDLVARLKAKPRAMTDHEDALLLHHQITLQNEHRRLAERIVAEGEADSEDMGMLRAKLADVSDQLQEVYDAGKAAGTETGRGLAARKMLARADYSLAAMETKLRAEKGGAALTGKEREQMVALHEKIVQTQRAFDDYAAQAREREAELRSQVVHAKLVAEEQRQAAARAKAPPTPAPEAKPRRRVTAAVADRLITAGDAAGERLRNRFANRLNDVTGVVEALPDVTVWAAGQLAKLTRATGRKAAELYNALRQRAINLVGDEIAPHFQRVFDDAVKMHEQAAAAPREEKAAGKAEAPSLLDKIRESVGDAPAVARYVQKLARERVAGGVTDRDKLIDAVHADVAPLLGEDWTRANTRDAISGYGEYKTLSKDEVSTKLRELKGEMQQVAKLEDMARGEAPKKTGVERREPSDAERRLIREVNETKKRLGIQTTDPETQLRSALDAVKANLDHRIADAEFELATGRREGQARTPAPSDAETEANRQRLAELREVRDAVFGEEPDRGAAKEKGLQEQISRLNAELAGAEADSASKSSSAAEPEPPNVVALRERLAELQAQKRASEGERLKVLTRSLEQQAAAYERAIAEARAGEWRPTEAAPTPPTSDAIDALAARRDALRAELDLLREADPNYQAAARAEAEDARTRGLETSIEQLDRRIAAGQLTGPGKAATVDTQEQATLRARRDALAKQLAEMRKAARPQRSPEEVALKAFKARTANRIAELADRMAREDYAPTPPRRPVSLDEEGVRLQAENERMKEEFQRSLLRNRLRNRTLAEKVQDTLVRWRRGFLLSSPVTLAKLTSAAAERMVFTPIEELWGGVISKALPGLAARAPREGGFSVRAEARAITQGFTKGMGDAWDLLRSGKSNLDLVHGHRVDDGLPPQAIDFFGHVHGALKSSAKRNEFARSFQKRVEHAIANGVDPTDPAVQVRIAKDAYVDASRAIFMQENRVVSAYRRMINALKEPDKLTGRTPAGNKLLATASEVLLPIVKVPTNVVAETFQYALGLVPGAARLGAAYARGIKSLPEHEADAIMRLLKKGSVGAAVMALGYFGAGSVGGYYQHGEKRDEKDVPVGGVRVFGHDVPKYLVHNPLLEALQIGATIRRVADARHKKSDPETQGLGAGATAAALGLVEEVPFIRTPLELAKAVDPRQRPHVVGRMVESLVVPAAVEFAARHLDDKDADGDPVKRKPETILQNVEMGIPGLRKRVPLKEEKPAPDPRIQDKTQADRALHESLPKEITALAAEHSRLERIPKGQRTRDERVRLYKLGPFMGYYEAQLKRLRLAKERGDKALEQRTREALLARARETR